MPIHYNQESSDIKQPNKAIQPTFFAAFGSEKGSLARPLCIKYEKLITTNVNYLFTSDKQC